MKIYGRTFFKKYTKEDDNFPFGIRLYDGVQGSGKSLSMVFDTLELLKLYPDTKVISNMGILGLENIVYYTTVDELINAINTNVAKHTIVLIDEGLTYFAENTGIDPAFMSQITQNRKNRRLIMISTQKFKRLNNRIRDFSLETVKCRSFLNFQVNIVRDDQSVHWDKEEMDFIGQKKYIYVFKRNNDLFNKYDTYQNIKLQKGQSTQYLFSEKQAPPATLVSPSKSIFKRKVK